MLALPGSAYLYQGEELGLHEVADLPGGRAAGPDLAADAQHQEGPRRLPGAAALDPRRPRRSASATVRAHLPQPAGFSRTAVAAQERTARVDPRALPGRAAGAPPVADRRGPGVAADRQPAGAALRPAGWLALHHQLRHRPGRRCPRVVVRVASGPLAAGMLPGETAVWLTDWPLH